MEGQALLNDKANVPGVVVLEPAAHKPNSHELLALAHSRIQQRGLMTAAHRPELNNELQVRTAP